MHGHFGTRIRARGRLPSRRTHCYYQGRGHVPPLSCGAWHGPVNGPATMAGPRFRPQTTEGSKTRQETRQRRPSPQVRQPPDAGKLFSANARKRTQTHVQRTYERSRACTRGPPPLGLRIPGLKQTNLRASLRGPASVYVLSCCPHVMFTIRRAEGRSPPSAAAAPKMRSGSAATGTRSSRPGQWLAPKSATRPAEARALRWGRTLEFPPGGLRGVRILPRRFSPSPGDARHMRKEEVRGAFARSRR